ncbi:hypothetical protein [uncultured Desulfobacter sp.]|uniref:hypothetical protein n=1 Tax=uncultured Desulfobacter sp. TaxID=240139 RepID=UPI002AAB6B0D|nr:hypothetical protein [uncultured Desulfobacter sp.]
MKTENHINATTNLSRKLKSQRRDLPIFDLPLNRLEENILYYRADLSKKSKALGLITAILLLLLLAS